MDITGSQAWNKYYGSSEDSINYFPENFVTRIFLSESPVKFLDKQYKGKTILDLGCGHGRNIPFLNMLGFDVSGLEVSEEHAAKLRTTFPQNNFYCGLSSSIPVAQDHFDYILACNSIYYLNDKDMYFTSNLKECARVLKNDGILIFSMIGSQHSILSNAEKHNQNAIIKNDFLGFRNETVICPLWTSADISSYLGTDFQILKHGEIREDCEGFMRHLHYYVAQKLS